MAEYREETDLLGPMRIPAEALWGVYTQRAIENFPLSGRPVHRALVHAYGAVKLAAVRTNHELGRWDDATFHAIEQACAQMQAGQLDDHMVVDALQGGAGTSTNMNVNEVIANAALRLLGRPPGDYQCISPLDDINLHQSTNDTFPTALRIAAIGLLRQLEQRVIDLVDAFQDRERHLAHVVKVGRTQWQDAVLTTMGRTMSAFADALARDRWRLHQCEERLRVVNLGGTAIGTGLSAPRQYIFRAVEHLRDVTGLGLARAENLVEATQNTDAFVEVSGIGRTLASNLLKISNDLRALASGPAAGLGELQLPGRQAGSSIMPGKVNPVIPEAVAQCSMVVSANDQVIMQACSAGNFELNQFMPLIADALLNSLELLGRACDIFTRHCVRGIEADEDRCRATVESATATVTALVDRIGYEAAQQIALDARERGINIRQAAIESGKVDPAQFDQLTSPEAVTRLGSSILPASRKTAAQLTEEKQKD
jgi:aspartate ammonia-lyase